MPFPHVTRRSRLQQNTSENHLEGINQKDEKNSLPRPSPTSIHQKEKFSMMSLSKGASHAPSSACFPLPPSTPTRSLLQRIQRRSSTSAESIVSMKQSSESKFTSSKVSKSSVVPQQYAKTSTPMSIKSSSNMFPQNAKSTMTASAIATLPRHRRTNSLLPQKSNTPISVKETTVEEVKDVQTSSEVAQSKLEEKLEIQRSTSNSGIVAKRINDYSCLKTLNQRRHSTLAYPKSSKEGLSNSLEKIETGIPTPPETLSPSSTTTEGFSSGKGNQVKGINQSSFNPVDSSKEIENSLLSEDCTEDFNSSNTGVVANITSDRSAILRGISENGNGLTRLAAKALEQEFASQERILQGLQRDNERKTVEVEELKRQKARLEEACAKYFGQDAWRDVIFAFSTSPKSQGKVSSSNAESEDQPSKRSNCSSKEPRTDAVGEPSGVNTEISVASMKSENDETNRSVMIVEDLLRTLSPPRKKATEAQQHQNKDLIAPAISVKSSRLSDQLENTSRRIKISNASTIESRTVIEHRPNQDDVSFTTTTGLAESSYFTAPDTSSSFSNSLKPNRSRSSFISTTEKNVHATIQVRKDLLMAMLDAQKRFTSQIHLEKGSHSGM